MKSLAAAFLAAFARAVVKRYRPRVVMVTGSVGKTSTKDAVATVLSARYLVRKSPKSFNSDFGVPFTVLNTQNPWGNPFAWLKVLKSALALLFLPNHYPNMLVLETGADKPGDLARILRIATPDAVVVTRLPEVPVHVEAYASPEAVREEEFSPALALPSGAPLIVSRDDAHALALALRTPTELFSYGYGEGATVRVEESGFCEEDGEVVGMRARIAVGETEGTLLVHGSVGKTQILPAAAALAAAHVFGIPVAEALKALESYEPPAGRGRLLKGKNGSILVDDSYNASPAAVEEALHTLSMFPHAKRRIAVLGDMLELGRYSVMEHERVGKLVAASVDRLVTVGIRARGVAESAQACGLSAEQISSFDDSLAAAEALKKEVEEGDVVLIKGSQSIRTERVAEALLKDPLDRKFLVRQDLQWKRRA